MATQGRASRSQGRRPTQAESLLELADAASLAFFQSLEGEPYVRVPLEGHVETLPLRGRGVGAFLRSRYYDELLQVPSTQAVADALGVLEQRALRGPRLPVAVRFGAVDGLAYLDLGGSDWRVVELSRAGWEVIPGHDSPLCFRRPAGLLELPAPERGGSVDELRDFLNLQDEDSFRLLVGWLVAALRHSGPYPLLALTGEQGCCKTTTARVLRRLLDPARAELRSEPPEARDLAVGAANCRILAFDNISHLPQWLSDGLCRVATGGGFSARRLYSDAEESILDFVRPTIVTSIADVLIRGDLLDRAILLRLPRVEDRDRRREADLWRAFEAARPRILGALLAAAGRGMLDEARIAAEVRSLPRMADTAAFVEAAAPALNWERGDFLALYQRNRADSEELALESAPIAAPLRTFLSERTEGFDGSATQLLDVLDAEAPESVRRARSWPRSPQAMGSWLRKLAPALRATGFDVDEYRQPGTGARRWRLQQRIARERRHTRHTRHIPSDSNHLERDEVVTRVTREADSRHAASPRNRSGSDDVTTVTRESGFSLDESPEGLLDDDPFGAPF